jgi:serine/threonine-protein kinase HipA
MESLVEVYVEGAWLPAATLVVTPQHVSFDYLPDYVFGANPQRVALSLPVSMKIYQDRVGTTSTPLAFLWDLVPQGRGRQYLEGVLPIPASNPNHDLMLAQHGAFAPIGRLRLDTAVAFYNEQTAGQPAQGFTRDDMHRRTDAFLEQLAMHSMLAAGTPGVQGVAPKYLLTQDTGGTWYPDVALPDDRAHQHWLVKLPRGRDEQDRRVLRHEAVYLRAAHACGLNSIRDPEYGDGMLFVRRFDRQVVNGTVLRFHQETLASLTCSPGFGIGASLFDLTRTIAEVTSKPAQMVAEFLCRETFNRALRNPDNHLRNTSIQQREDGAVQLTPLYDVSPMYLDAELIARTCRWTLPNRQTVDNWDDIFDNLLLDKAVKTEAACLLKEFGETRLPMLTDLLRDLEADEQIIEACRLTIDREITKLQEFNVHAKPSP